MASQNSGGDSNLPALDPNKSALTTFISNLVANVGSVGVLMWLVTFQMPEQQKVFLAEIRIEREVRQSQTDKLITAISDLAREVREIKEKKE